MVAYLFILGISGSGKSSIARHIVTHARQRHVRVAKVSDYSILLKMCRQDIDNKQFHSTEYDGFHVVECVAYDKALKQLEKQVQKLYSKNKDLVIIEFARADLVKALQCLEENMLKESSFLFVNASIPVCRDRVQKRVLSRKTLDDHFVPQEVFKLYEGKDNMEYLSSVAVYLEREFGVQPSSISFIDNDTPWEEDEPVINKTILMQVDNMVEKLLADCHNSTTV